MLERFDDWLHHVKFRARKRTRLYRALYWVTLPACWLRGDD